MATYNPSESDNYYFLGDSHAEMVHLIETDRYFNRAMGGLLPELPDQSLSGIHRVLDVACGPGGWAFELARAYPHLDVTGMDISERMIDYASAQARASGLDNLHFLVANAMEPFGFPDASFDLVNARHLEGVIPTAAFPALYQEMFRVTRPGGIIRVVGSEWGVTNGAIFEKLQRVDLRAWQPVGLTLAPDDRNCGITAFLRRFLRDAGCVDIQERPSIMDVSAGAEFQQAGYQIFSLVYEMIEPFFLSLGIMTREELAHERNQLSLEMLDDNFRGIIYTLTAWGRKP